MKESHGSLVDIGLPELLHLIYKRNDTFGVLNISREPIRKRFFFANGIPVFATSNILGEVLGRLLMLEGIITQSDYEKSLEVVLNENKRHGAVLISMGLITDAELDNFLYLQLKRRAWKIFGWNEGTYRYETLKELPAGATPMPLHPAKLILDGISLGFYPLVKIREELDPYLDTVLVPAFESTRYKIEDFSLNIQETRFFENFNGTATVKEVLDSSFLLKQRALSLTLTLVMTGVLAKPDEKSTEDGLALAEEPNRKEGISTAPGSRLNAELLFMRAKSDFSKSNFKSAVDTLKQIVEINPMEGEYWAWLGWTLYNFDPSCIKEAERTVKDAIDLNNELDGAWYFLARIFFDKGEHEAAKKAYITACDKNPWMLEAVAELKRIEIRRSLGIGTSTVPLPGYVDYFSFTLDPFSMEPHDRFKIPVSAQAETLETTLCAIQKKEGPILIEAAEGNGKTTLLIELLRRLSNKKTLAAVILSPAKKELELIKDINTELHATTESNSIKEQLLSLGMRVSQNNSQGGSTIIVLDNADRLTTGCLKLVQYLARLRSLQLILVGRPGISDRLGLPDFTELNRKTLVRLNIGPLTTTETGEFFRKRVSLTPTSPPTATRPAIDQPALDLLHEASNGTAAKIIRCCAQLLEAAAKENKNAIGATLAARVFGINHAFAADATKEGTNRRDIQPEINDTPAVDPADATPAAQIVTEAELELIEPEKAPAPAITPSVAPPVKPVKGSTVEADKTEETFELKPVEETVEETDAELLDNEPIDPNELIVEVDKQKKNEPDLGLLEDVIETTGKKGVQKTEEAATNPVAPKETETPEVTKKEETEEPKEQIEVETIQKQPKKRGSLTRTLLIIILMIVLGLAAGSLVNQYFLNP